MAGGPAWRNAPADRTCRGCGEGFTGKYNSTKCPSCRTAKQAEVFENFKASNPEYWKDWAATRRASGATRDGNLRRQYGISKTEFDAMRAQVGYACPICFAVEGSWRANAGLLVVDHDHETGDVRGVICPSCNRGIGQLKDDAKTLRRAADYLESARG
jgi:hypothetical protein